MTYRIAQISPLFHHSTDAVIGYSTRIVREGIETAAFAMKIARDMTRAEYENCGDSYFEARDSEGNRIIERVRLKTPAELADCTF
jgi:hypothetical protein